MKLAHLCKPSQFNAVMQGRRLGLTQHFSLHVAPAETEWREPQLGVILAKRFAKRAVTRNAIRRQIYAVAQIFSERFQPCAYAVRLRSAFSAQNFFSASSPVFKKAVRTELQGLFGQLSPSQTLQQAALR